MTRKSRRSVKAAWNRLERWCGRCLPRLLKNFNSGATTMQVQSFERAIGRELPNDVRESYAIHNGQAREGEPTGLIFGLPILPLARVLKEWKAWRPVERHNAEFRARQQSFPNGAIQLDYTNPGWIPLTLDWSGNHIGVDLAPGSKGTLGQVIVFGRDEDKKFVAAPSWAAFLNDIADELERGNYLMDDEQRDFNIKVPRVKHFHQAIARRYRSRGV